MKVLKGVAILFMLLLHLFARKEINGLYDTYIWINDVPLLYYFALFGDACVPIFCFASGYGLYVNFQKTGNINIKENFIRVIKLLINFWIILVLFVTIGFFLGKEEIYPGTVTDFLLNFFLLSNSYNGAWWFMQTYVLLVIISPIIFMAIKKYNTFMVLGVTGVIYLLSYIQRIKGVLDLGENTPLIISVNAIVLLGTSLLPFIIGAIFVKDRFYSVFVQKVKSYKHKNIIFSLGILLLIIIHSLYESMIIAPITSISFICLFNLMNKNNVFKKILSFCGKHSTNIWLSHMFFYSTIFKEMTFAPRSAILIYIWLLILCIISSCLINLIYYPILSLINKMPRIPRQTKGITSNNL